MFFFLDSEHVGMKGNACPSKFTISIEWKKHLNGRIPPIPPPLKNITINVQQFDIHISRSLGN